MAPRLREGPPRGGEGRLHVQFTLCPKCRHPTKLPVAGVRERKKRGGAPPRVATKAPRDSSEKHEISGSTEGARRQTARPVATKLVHESHPTHAAPSSGASSPRALGTKVTDSQ